MRFLWEGGRGGFETAKWLRQALKNQVETTLQMFQSLMGP